MRPSQRMPRALTRDCASASSSCAGRARRRGARFHGRPRRDFHLPFTPRSELVQRGFVSIQLDFFVHHLTVFQRFGLPSVLRERFALDAAKFGRLFDPLVDLGLGRRVEHDGRLAPLRCWSTSTDDEAFLSGRLGVRSWARVLSSSADPHRHAHLAPDDRDQGLGTAGVALTTASLPAEHGNLDSFQPTPICRRGVAPQASPVPRTHRASSSACAFSPDWGHTEYSGGILQRDATGMERTASCDAGARAPNSPSPNESRRIDEPFPRVPALTNKGVPSCASE